MACQDRLCWHSVQQPEEEGIGQTALLATAAGAAQRVGMGCTGRAHTSQEEKEEVQAAVVQVVRKPAMSLACKLGVICPSTDTS